MMKSESLRALVGKRIALFANRGWRHQQLLTGLLFVCIGAFGTSGWTQEVTPQEKKGVRMIETNIDRAGKYFQKGNLQQAADYVTQATSQMAAATLGARAELIEILSPEFERLKVAHQLLTDAGQTLPELKPLPQPVSADLQDISFTTAVAPILVAKCGKCHVDQNKGDFSSATFQALDASTTLAYGLPQDSKLIEVIESGEMPKGGLKVEPNELQILKLWMLQGAKFDGDDPGKNLNQYVNADAGGDADAMKAPEIATPTGKETVSFGLHVAPILIENCARCHIDANNLSGNLNMGVFKTLLAGGDGGPIVVPGKSGDSPMFNRINAGEMPPDGKLDGKLIDVIRMWIDEGAKFDGGDPEMALRSVAAKVKADSQTHQELAGDRKGLASQTWELVMDEVESGVVDTKNFNVVGSTTESRLTDVSFLVEEIVPEVIKTLKAENAEPFIKGNVTVFVFDKRYDFSEFGKMVEKVEFPKQVSGYWGFTTIDAYATVLMTRNQKAADTRVSLTHQISAVYVSSLAPDVPRWFADGVGYWAAKKICSKEEEVKTWDALGAQAAASMKKPDDFIMNKMPADKAGLVSYLFVKTLKSKGANFNRLMEAMKDGQSFEKSFVQAYGSTAQQMLSQAYGQNKKW